MAFGQATSSVVLAWNADSSPGIVSYNLYAGGASQSYTNVVSAGNATNATVSGLVQAATYFFAVTAVNSAGLESMPSPEISYSVPVTNTPAPAVVLASPVNGASYLAPASISLSANVTANGHTITTVQFFNGSTLLGGSTSAPYSFPWNGVAAGNYSLTAQAVYDAGSNVASAAVAVVVTNALPPPAVVLASPTSGASYLAPANISLSANVTANGHTITKVQFLNGSTLLGASTSMPYSLVWNGVAAGNYSLTAQAVYDAGSNVASGAVAVLVTNALPPPAVVLTSPTNGASYAAPASINLLAGVTPNGHTITQVQFFNGSTLLGVSASTPYSFLWNNVSAGNYSLAAQVVYDAGSSVLSAPAAVAVTGLPAPWQTIDIGSVGILGSAVISNGLYGVAGAGNLSGGSDSFRFLYQTLTADGEIRGQISSVQGSGGGGADAGAMIRENLASGSRYAFMGITPAGFFRWQRRSSTSGGTSTTKAGSATPPKVWVRVVRTGNTLYGYKSTDGVNWTLVNSSTISMSANAYIGWAVASGSSTTLDTSVFTNVTVVP
ncbi:MAG TPA: Ig-like domain-containing protein [Candidatus Acidoferrum sp.]|nr:Ig-like domain-containing protein [Candidatus Acidoferrum sp.]